MRPREQRAEERGSPELRSGEGGRESPPLDKRTTPIPGAPAPHTPEWLASAPAGALAVKATAAELAEVARTRLRDACEAVWRREGRVVQKWLYKKGLPRDFAEDVAQETALALQRALPRYDARLSSLRTFAIRVAKQRLGSMLEREAAHAAKQEFLTLRLPREVPLHIDEAVNPKKRRARLKDKTKQLAFQGQLFEWYRDHMEELPLAENVGIPAAEREPARQPDSTAEVDSRMGDLADAEELFVPDGDPLDDGRIPESPPCRPLLQEETAGAAPGYAPKALPRADALLDKKRRYLALHGAIRALPRGEREVMELYLADLDLGDIAVILRRSPGEIYRRYERAIPLLREKLAPALATKMARENKLRRSARRRARAAARSTGARPLRSVRGSREDRPSE